MPPAMMKGVEPGEWSVVVQMVLMVPSAPCSRMARRHDLYNRVASLGAGVQGRWS